MKRTRWITGFALFVSAALPWLPTTAAAEPTTRPTTSPVTVRHVVRRAPNESVFVTTVDLTDPRVRVQVARAGDVPAGDGAWQTTLLPTSEIAARQGWDYAVNGDFFSAEATKDVEGNNTGFVRGKRARPLGPAVTDGTCWSRNATTRPALEVTAYGHARVATVDGNAALPADVRQAVAGNSVIVKDGVALHEKTKFAAARNPRTAAGVNRAGTRLILVVVDGRQPALSAGMTFDELAAEMVADGAYTALNLDGGGSTTLVARDATTGKLAVLNSPSDTKERSVADALGITVVAPASRR